MQFEARYSQVLTILDKQLCLDGEGIPEPIADPTDDQISAELMRMRATGPSLLALIAPNGSYLQAVGSARNMIIEGCFVRDASARLFQLGRYRDLDAYRTVSCTRYRVPCSACQVWSARAAATLFLEFARTRVAPQGAGLWDMTRDLHHCSPLDAH